MKIIKIGRNQENDHVITSDDYVSDFHCELSKDNYGNAYITDTDSTNGTFINGRGIPKQREWKLNKGDVIKIGSETFINWQSLLNIEHNTSEFPPYPTGGKSGIEDPKPPKQPVNWKSVLGIIMTIMSFIMMLFMLLKMLG